MNKYIEFVLEWPKLVVLFFFCMTVYLSLGMTKLGFDNSVEAFMPKNDNEYVFYNQTKDIYGDNGRFFIMSVSDKNLFSKKSFKKIDAFISDIEEYKDYDMGLEIKRMEKFDSIAKKNGIKIKKNDFLSMFKDDPRFYRLIQRKAEKEFGAGETSLDQKRLKKLRKDLAYSEKLKKAEMVDKIISPFTSQDISGANDTLDNYDLIPRDDNGKRILPETEKDFAAFKKRLRRNPAFKKGIYAVDPQTDKITDLGVIVKFINLKNQDDISREILEIAQSHKDIKIIPQGAPVVNIWFNNYLHRDLQNFLPLVMLAVIIIFFFNFRSIRGVVLPFFTLGMSTIWILGLMGHMGFKITGLTDSLPALMIAVGSSYSIHILNQYYADFTMIGEKGLKKGLSLSMAHISTTVLLAALTTFVAFITLSTSSLSAVREWGIFAGIGVLFAVFISSSIIPAGLVLLPHKIPYLMLNAKKNKKITIIDKIIQLMTKISIHHSKAVVVIVGILICVSVAGMFRMRVESEFLQYFKEDDPIRTSAAVIEQKFGGRWGFDILIDSGKEDGVKNPRFLQTVEKIRNWLTSDKNRSLNIGRTDSFSDYIKTMNMAMNNDDQAYYKIPGSREDILDYLELYSGDDENSDGRADEFESYVNPDFRTCNILARLCQKEDYPIGTNEANKTITRVSKYLAKILPSRYKNRITGFPLMNIKMAHYIITGQLKSLLLSLVVIAIIVTLLFCRFKAGFISLIPMVVAVIINFGIMGWLGINLDTVTSIIAAITIGIGVDDTIHFLNTFRHNREMGLTIDETITKTLAVSGKAIIYTSMALIFGFAVLMISNFKPVILFGILMGITMTATTIGALMVIPSVIKLSGVTLKRKESEMFIWKYINLGRIFGLEQLE